MDDISPKPQPDKRKRSKSPTTIDKKRKHKKRSRSSRDDGSESFKFRPPKHKHKKSKSSHDNTHKSSKRKKDKRKIRSPSPQTGDDQDFPPTLEDPFTVLTSIVEGQEHLSHEQVVKIVEDTMSYIIQEDPLLKGLDNNASLEEIDAQIAFEEGRGIQVNVVRADGQIQPIIVDQTAKVIDLKKAIQRYTQLKLEREKIQVTINWKYVWRTHWLYFNRQKLRDNNDKLSHYELYNGCQVTFIRRLREKQKNYKRHV